MTREEALILLKERDRKVVMLTHLEAVLGWDFETGMPPKGGSERAEQLSYIATSIHDIKSSPELIEAIAVLDGEDLEVEDKALVRVWKKELRTSVKLPSSFVEKLSLETSLAHDKWVEARAKNDFSLFAPKLETLISLEKEMASIIGDGSYDTLLDLYEEGATVAQIDPIFSDLEATIHSIMDKIGNVEVEDSFLYEPYDTESLHSFCLEILDKAGFDSTRASVGITVHPFTSTLGCDDVRISTRYTDSSLFDPIASIIHEMGHAFYELESSLNPKIRGTSLSGGLYMGIHEAQSRFWENLVGRSEAFWSYFYPKLQENLPHLKAISLVDFIKAINKPQSSAIRVNADELTYSLHIILRYQMEKEIINGNIKVKELPSLWNDLSEKIIRYKVKNDSEGILQDSHWAGGSFGYFPSYALGNIYSLMFYKRMCTSLSGEDVVNKLLQNGELHKIKQWQSDNIWENGSIYTPDELLKKVTGSKIDVSPYKEYLLNKFTHLYE